MIHQHFWPHGYCLMWDKPLIAVFILGHVLVFLAYLGLPWELYRGLRHARMSIPKEARGMVLDFALFIVACGGGHLIVVFLLWFPVYWFEALWALFGTALFSWRCLLRIHGRMQFYLPLLISPADYVKLNDEVELLRKAVEGGIV